MSYVAGRRVPTKIYATLQDEYLTAKVNDLLNPVVIEAIMQA